MNKKVTIAVIAISIALLIAIFVLVVRMGGEKQVQSSDAVGFVLPGDKDEIGWNGFQYQGVKTVTDELGVNLLLAENVAEKTGACEKSVDSLVKAGARMIILGSFNFPIELQEYIKSHQDVKFYGISGDLHQPNFTAYSARAYQARFLSGVIAALNSESGKIGYVAAMKNSEVYRGINAFALGARRINPKAKVYVAWSNSWDDEIAEKANTEKLIKGAGVDVMAYHQNRTYVVEAAEALGVKSVAYNLYSSSYSPNVLASSVTNWSKVYKEIILDFVQKKTSVNNYWVGIEKDAVGVEFYSSAVSDTTKQVVKEIVDSMKNGMDVFVGPIYDNKQQKRCEKDELISDNILRDEMDWLVDGVSEYEN